MKCKETYVYGNINNKKHRLNDISILIDCIKHGFSTLMTTTTNQTKNSTAKSNKNL